MRELPFRKGLFHVSAVLLFAAALPAVPARADAAESTRILFDDTGHLAADPRNAIACGGIADPQCPGGSFCADIPEDGCSPLCGADCSGFCAEIPRIPCGGFANLTCPAGLSCIDDPADHCTPDCGGADCPGVCVELEGTPCLGFAGAECPAGFTCVDHSGDNCHPGCGGADCSGDCMREAPAFCGGIAQIPCPGGLQCIDDPSDDCDTDCGGADCSGICVDPVETCGRSELPECGGACPGDQQCVPSPDQGSCACQPIQTPCGEATAPTCDGTCPDGARCIASSVEPEGPCICASCTSVVPGTNIGVVWPSPQFMTWEPLPCAITYNSYRITVRRLVDEDGNGVADDYGACLQPDLTFPVAADPSEPPPEFTSFYLITGENAVGEGSMGLTSRGLPRPNLHPCR